MIMDIFSSFDDMNQVFMSMYVLMWFLPLLSVCLLGCFYWIFSPCWNNTILVLKDTVASQVFRSFGLRLGGFINLISGLFILLVFLNLSGLIPYVFSCTSHLAVTFCLSFPLWLCLIISAVTFNFSSYVASLLPMGAPGLLSPFLVCIETVSIGVRSITISVRLMANMSAGHIVLTLNGNYLSASFSVMLNLVVLVLVLIQISYTVFEFGISGIQAYVFCLLNSLFANDHPASRE